MGRPRLIVLDKKTCLSCGNVYDWNSTFFYKNKSVSDGLSTYCKTCCKEINRNAPSRHVPRKRTIKDKERDHLKYLEYKKTGRITLYKKKRFLVIGNKIADNLRSRVWAVLNRCDDKKTKFYEFNEYIGCSPFDLRKHLESLFKEGMNWDNYGNNGWWVDHIVACKKFDLSDPEEQKKCFHYTNLQPLWWWENIGKGCR